MNKTGKIITLIILILLTSVGCMGDSDKFDIPDIYPAKILKITDDRLNELDTSGGVYQQRIQEADVLMLDGPYKGQTIKVINTMDQFLAYDIELHEGREIYTMLEMNTDGTIKNGLVYQYRRDKYMYILVIAFFFVMVLVGGMKGIRTLFTLGLTLLGIYMMLVGIVRGGDPVLLSIVVCVVIAVVTMFFVAGFNSKAISAIVGTMGGVLVSGIIAIIISKYAVLTGLGTSEAQLLMFSQGDMTFDFSKILFASILLGTLGAVMDVCISIASAINEITEANPFMLTRDLFRSGMNIGRDIMGTMANTLILAYAGTSIFLILVFFMNGIPYLDIINMDSIATEIVRAIGGTIGLVTCIPLTAYMAAVLEKKNVGNY